MDNQAQISAVVSKSTKEKLNRFTERHGLKKNAVIERALLFFMEARRELPDEAFIPSRVVLESGSFEKLVDTVENPPAPTPSLVELMNGNTD